VRRAAPEAEVDGSPHLAVRDEDREAVVEALADLLVAVLERGAEEQTA
jgi:hypothetical protein